MKKTRLFEASNIFTHRKEWWIEAIEPYLVGKEKQHEYGPYDSRGEALEFRASLEHFRSLQ